MTCARARAASANSGPNRRYQRTARVMTSGGKRYPAKAEYGAGRTGRCRRDLIARVSLMRTPAANATVPPEALSARQREHRLRERVRPKMPVDAHADPWIVADEGLDALDRIRPLLRRSGQAWEELEVAAERLRRLAWGPSPGGSS